MSNAPYKLIDQIKDQIESNNLFVEIGSDRGNGSTGYFQTLADDTGNSFITVDVDPIHLSKKIQTATMTGEEWVKTELPKLSKKISLVFLDGFDCIDSPVSFRNGTLGADTYNLVDEYKRKGLILNNVNSAVAHMLQTIGMLPFMDDKCVVLFGDTRFNHLTDSFVGKGAGAIYLLLAEGFKIISASPSVNYVLLARGIRNDGLTSLNMSVLSEKYTGPKARPDTILYKNLG